MKYNTFEEIRLKAEMVATQALVPLDPDITVDTLIDYTTESLVLRLKKFVYTSDEQDIEVPLPDGVWQHFKQDYLPKWYLDKYPVVYKYIIVKAKEVFPHLSYLAHNNARHLHLRVQRGIQNFS